MSLNLLAQAPYLRNLVCAYTGKPADVRVVSGKIGTLYFAAAAFDPGTYVESSVKLLYLLGFRNGVEGSARNGAELTCPYTGARMTIERHPELGFRAVGGFRPSLPQKDSFKFAADMMTRGGVTPKNAPVAVRVVASVNDGPAETAEERRVSDDTSLEMAEGILKDSIPVKTMITVPAKPKGKKGK